MINDWPGTRFVTTHRCFGGPCKDDAKLQLVEEPPKVTEKTFKVGDLQEHRYPYARAWQAGGWTHDESRHIEDVHDLIHKHFDPFTGSFKSPYQIAWDKEMAEEAELERNKDKPAFKVPESVIDDWTGQKYVDNMHCHGKDKPCPKLEDIRAA